MWDFQSRSVILVIIWFICLLDFCWLGSLLEEMGKVQALLFAPSPVASKCHGSDLSRQMEASKHPPRKMNWQFFRSPNLICRNLKGFGQLSVEHTVFVTEIASPSKHASLHLVWWSEEFRKKQLTLWYPWGFRDTAYSPLASSAWGCFNFWPVDGYRTQS